MSCRIQFLDGDLTRFQWRRVDVAGKQESGEADSGELKQVCAKAGPVSVFLPQQDILLTRAMLPPRASKQQLNAIAFAIEEQLADDIDDDFFAVLPQQADHSVPVAVISRDIMDRLTALLGEQHVQSRHVLPQVYLCPISHEDDWLASVCALEDGYLVRYGQHAGFYCSPAALGKALALLRARFPQNPGRVDFYGDDAPPELQHGGLQCQQFSRLDPLAGEIEFATCINLKQKEYQSSNAWLGLIKSWRWPLLAVMLLLAVFGANTLVGYWRMDAELRDLVGQQQQLLKTHLPEVTPGAHPKDQLVKALAANRSPDQDAGFLNLLHEYAELNSSVRGLTTSKILFQQSRLVVNVESQDLRSLDALREKLASSRFPASVENVNIKPEQTTARVILGAEK